MSSSLFNRTAALASMAVVCLACTVSASPAKVAFEVALSNPALEANRSQKTHLKVGLTGFDLASTDRAPVNLCIVLDRSGSMSGDKIRRAREAALMVVDMLTPHDILSLVTYESTVRTLVPATYLANKDEVRRAIRGIEAGGSTALFGGVSKGIREVRRNVSKERVNRVLLLSDGLANVGPSSPHELASLGRSAGREGIAITTIGLGLGYNEDLMTQLALSSDGNHAFAETSTDLARIFDSELGDVLSVVAQDVEIIIRCPAGIRPIRVVDREATIKGQDVTLYLNQIYSKQEKYVILEVEVPSEKAGVKRKVASVDVAYDNLSTQSRDTMTQLAYATFTASKEKVRAKTNRAVAVQATKAIANEESRRAVELRDKGDVAAAQKVMSSNAGFLKQQAEVLGSNDLRQQGAQFDEEAEALDDDAEWNKNRKLMRKRQYKESNQMSY